MFDLDFESIALTILNRQAEERDMPEELEAVKAELRVYQDMQANLNTNLAEFPDFLDAIENLQCSVYPPGEIPSPYKMATDIYDSNYRDLKDKVKRLHGELAAVRAELRVYEDMQANLNTNLALFPDFLDAIEDLQCSVYPPGEIPYPHQMVTDIPYRNYKALVDEVKRLRGELDDQARQIGIYDVTLQLGLENELRLERRIRDLEQLNRNQVLMLEDYEADYNKYYTLALMAQDYRDNANMWRKAYEDLK